MFRVKNKLLVLLHVSLALLFLGCEINNTNQNYLSNTSHREALIFPKETKATQKEEEKSNPFFINESLVNKTKLQEREKSSQSLLSRWWLFAIAISIFTVIYFMRKQKIIFEKLQKRSE